MSLRTILPDPIYAKRRSSIFLRQMDLFLSLVFSCIVFTRVSYSHIVYFVVLFLVSRRYRYMYSTPRKILLLYCYIATVYEKLTWYIYFLIAICSFFCFHTASTYNFALPHYGHTKEKCQLNCSTDTRQSALKKVM